MQLTEPPIAWADEHAELITPAQECSRRHGRDVGMLTGTDEFNVVVDVD